MKFHETQIAGVWLIEPVRFEDARGFFSRTWSRALFAERGLRTDLEQSSLSFNPHVGTLRGMHYQIKPNEEAKLVRCTRGAIYDVVVDLRPESPTYCGWTAAELTAENHRLFYIPEGCAHGLLTLAENTEVFYQIAGLYSPECYRGVRWNDPAFKIRWPAEVRVIADRDRDYADYQKV
ncbi:MAG: dTDP-4-dehydrorhamnose 3,5-epimerase [Planctomycetota bacterium]